MSSEIQETKCKIGKSESNTYGIHKYTFVMKLAQLCLPKLRWGTKLEAHISRRSMPNKEFMCRASHTSFAHSNHLDFYVQK